MNRWDAFTAVCGHLRAGLLGGEPPRRHPSISWELLVEVSSHHRVTPALAWCLKDRPDVPAEAREYLDTILALNGRRNEALLAALARIVAACNAIGAEPVPLKGAARLIECNYPAPSLRFLGDLDVLIPAERSGDAVAALQAIGFRANADFEALHHLPMLYDREAGGAVELHTDVVPGDGAKVIPTDWFQAGTCPFAYSEPPNPFGGRNAKRGTHRGPRSTSTSRLSARKRRAREVSILPSSGRARSARSIGRSSMIDLAGWVTAKSLADISRDCRSIAGTAGSSARLRAAAGRDRGPPPRRRTGTMAAPCIDHYPRHRPARSRPARSAALVRPARLASPF